MNIEELRDYCLAKPAVEEGFPFDETTLVFKVMGKMFCLTDLVDAFSINIKNNPEKIIEYRADYSSVLPGYHMHKKYWNTVMIDGTISDQVLKLWIDESYQEVINSLTRKEKLKFVEMGGDASLVLG